MIKDMRGEMCCWFGTSDKGPFWTPEIIDLPRGAEVVAIRMRNDEFARAMVRLGDVLSVCYLDGVPGRPGCARLGAPIGINMRKRRKQKSDFWEAGR